MTSTITPQSTQVVLIHGFCRSPMQRANIYPAPVGEQGIAISLSACLSARISLEPLDRFSQNFVRRSPVALARSSSCGVAIRYVLPVLWMTSWAVWRCVDGWTSAYYTA